MNIYMYKLAPNPTINAPGTQKLPNFLRLDQFQRLRRRVSSDRLNGHGHVDGDVQNWEFIQDTWGDF